MAASTRRILRGAIADAISREDGADGDAAFDARRPPPALDDRFAKSEAPPDDRGSMMLSRFLLAADERGDGGDGRRSCRSRLNACLARPGSMDSMDACWFSLVLEPRESRSARVIMLGEAYALFGALFLSCTWILYEYGSEKGYGEADEKNQINHVFEAVMALAIMCNTFLALNGMTLWVLSVLHSESNQQWVFTVRGMLSLCQSLVNVTVLLDFIGLVLAVYSNLSPRWPETIICFVVAVLLYISFLRALGDILVTSAPLEFYHTPLMNQLVNNPASVLTKKGRQKLQTDARARAEELKQRAYQRRGAIDPNQTQQAAYEVEGQYPCLDIGALLRGAASRLGKSKQDVTSYEARLAGDWIEEVNQLRGMSVDFLTRYMPWALANEVHRSLMVEECGEA